MTREELTELHSIQAIVNVPSILELGILSFNRARGLEHTSVALPKVQDMREGKMVPGGRPLHDYANLYLYARNVMMYARKGRHHDLCVIQVSTQVLDLPGVVVTDGNAASAYVRFAAAPGGIAMVDGGLLLAESWVHDSQIDTWRHRSAKCAEVLVPDCVPPGLVVGAYVSCDAAAEALRATGFPHPITLNPHLFFL